MIRVLHVTGAYPTQDKPYASPFLELQVASLRDRGIEADVCLLEGKGAGKYIAGVARVRHMLSEKRYDLIHAHYTYAGWTARLASTLPLVVSFMGNDVFGNTDALGNYSKLSVVGHWGLSNLLSLASHHVTVKSRRLGDRIWFNNKSIVPDGVDLDVFRPYAVDRQKLGLSADKFLIMFAGRKTDPVKRYWLAEQAVQRLQEGVPQAELITVEGRGRNELVDFMNAVDCLLLTSTHEGSPNVVKEVLACNLPVVSVDVGDVKERVEGIEGCRVVDARPESLADALAQVRARGKRLEHAREKVAEVSLAWTADRLIQIYREALSTA
jgi:glycosyltransferase involved in cell wall biosynthesis